MPPFSLASPPVIRTTGGPQTSRTELVLLVLALATLLIAATLIFSPFTASASAQSSEIIVHAHGRDGTEQMALIVNGDEVEQWTVTDSPQDYVVNVGQQATEIETIEVQFINDENVSRDLFVDHVDIGGLILESSSPDTITTGTYVEGEGCVERPSDSDALHCDGSFFYPVPEGTVLRPVVQRLSARVLGATGTEQIEIAVNDEVLLEEKLEEGWQVLAVDMGEGVGVEDVELSFINDDGPRDVRVDYLEVEGVRYESEDALTRVAGAWVDGECTTDSASNSEWLRCDGSFHYTVDAETASDIARAVATPSEDQPAFEEADPAIPTQVETNEATGPTEITRSPLIDRDIIEWFSGHAGTTPEETEALVSAVPIFVNPFPDPAPTTVVPPAPFPTPFDPFDVVSVPTTAPPPSLDDFPTIQVTPNSPTPEFPATFLPTVNPFPSAVVPTNPFPSAVVPTNPFPSAVVPTNPFASTSSNGQFSIADVIDGTIGSGDGSNPNEEAPAGRHDAPLSLIQNWNWAQGPTRNSQWGQLGTGGSQFAEFRCAVIPELGHTPPVDFRVNVRNGAYYQFVNNNWRKAFDVDLTGGNHGGYLGNAGQITADPFGSGGHGLIEWRREADGSFSAPWDPDALFMHFWAAERQAPAPGQTAEFLTSELRLQQPDGRTVDLNQVRVLFQCGVDYYSTTGGQGTQVPGPGIGKYHRATQNWQPSLWVTLPQNTPANSVSDFTNWLAANTPPNVG